MKKTLTVNLGGIVFQIDEDAYILLDNYLNNLRSHFRKEEGEEIVCDIEMRISELFTEEMQGGQQVVTIDNVESVINRMGRPDQLDDEDNKASSEDSDTSYGKDSTSDFNTRNSSGEGTQSVKSEYKKRLFRDVDNRVLGGVASGIAAYFGWDPTAVRLAFIVLGLLPAGPSMLLIYLVLLFIIPPARTATEKLQMRGEPINMENIGKTVTDGFERKGHPEENSRQKTGLHRFLDGIISIIGVLIKIFLFFLAVCCIPVFFGIIIMLFILIMTSIGIFVHIPELCCDVLPNLPWNFIGHFPFWGFLILINALLFVGIPLFCIVQVICQSFGYWKPMTSMVKVSLLILWLISLVGGFILLFHVSTLNTTSQFLGI